MNIRFDNPTRLARTTVVAAALAGTLLALLLLGATQASANHVACGDTITADTTLDSDLIGCPGHGLTIGADDVTLDLNHYSIISDGVTDDLCSGPEAGDYGIDNSAGHAGLTVENGSIGGFEEGVYLSDADDNLVSNVDVSADPAFILCQGIYSEGGDRVGISDSSVGITQIRGIGVISSTGAVIERNTVSFPRHAGIALWNSAGGRVAHNSMNGTPEFGVELIGTDGSVVTANTVTGGEFDGIVLALGANYNLVEQNTVSNVRGDPDPSDPGQFAGIEVVDDASHNQIVGNLLFDNEAPGIAVGLPLSNSSPSRANIVSGNTVRDNDNDGVVIGGRGTGTLIERTTALRNGDDGIDADNRSTTITANAANSNGDLGIEAIAGVTDGGGNGAASNANPLRCRNVFCAPVKAAGVSRSGSTLVVTAATGAKDNLTITRPTPSTLRVSDLSSAPYTGSRVGAGTGCTQSGDRAVNCANAGGITLVKVDSGDQIDKVVNATAIKSSVDGGPANDILQGGSAADTLTGATGIDVLKGMNGNDLLQARDLASDQTIACGGGSDEADLDLLPIDPNSAITGCETKTRH